MLFAESPLLLPTAPRRPRRRQLEDITAFAAASCCVSAGLARLRRLLLICLLPVCSRMAPRPLRQQSRQVVRIVVATTRRSRLYEFLAHCRHCANGARLKVVLHTAAPRRNAAAASGIRELTAVTVRARRGGISREPPREGTSSPDEAKQTGCSEPLVQRDVKKAESFTPPFASRLPALLRHRRHERSSWRFVAPAVQRVIVAALIRDGET